MNLEPGISVIIPVYTPERKNDNDRLRLSDLRKALLSLKNQSIEFDLLEVILVLNGPDSDNDSYQKCVNEFGDLHIRIFRTSSPGAGKARNIGIASSSRQFITFLDSDDRLAPKFLEMGLKYARQNVVAMLPVVDIVGEKEVVENPLNIKIKGVSGSRLDISLVPWSLGFNASKIVPTQILKKYRYDEDLRSGEDVAFFANLFQEEDLLLEVPKDPEGSEYKRTITRGSVSRQSKNFDFLVRQRLETIAKLKAIPVKEGRLAAINSLVHSQFGFVSSYLEENKDQVSEARKLASQLGIWGLNWEDLIQADAQKLVISYCFPPYADTSANVVAKVIREEGLPVDVIYSNMSRVRQRDESTLLIVEPFISHAEEINVEPSFSDWDLICAFARKASKKALRRSKQVNKYESVYSRALWSGSHVAAALIKIGDPSIRWEAEFSDPLALGVTGEIRPGPLSKNRVTHQLRKVLKNAGMGTNRDLTHFELTELVTFALADEVIFTNQNQLEVVLCRYPLWIQKQVRSKAQVHHHAVPTPEMYNMVKSDYVLNSEKVNIAYFGNFYKNRGLNDVFQALASTPKELLRHFQFHIFTNDAEGLSQLMWQQGLSDVVKANGYLPYLEFLNLASQCDGLVVNDVDINGSEYRINPFLPSKYADYIGSGAVVWGLLSPDSPLGQLPLHYRSQLGDVEGAIKIVSELCSQKA